MQIALGFQMIRLLLVFALITAGLAKAEGRPMSGDDFRALSEGWTLHFEDELGEYFGSEQFFTGDATVWAPRGGECQPGWWEEDEGRICFYYATGSACWRLFQTGADEMLAIAANDVQSQPPLRLRLIRKDKGGLLCKEEPGV